MARKLPKPGGIPRERPSNICCGSSTPRAEMCRKCHDYWAEYMRLYMQGKQADLKARGLCQQCGIKKVSVGHTRCDRCLAYHRTKRQ